ncbi:TPA: hypothetical protein DDW35_10430 [Candidatus Sumerlaeota bacterium]|nr:hypothetical protein [Candidatus Sumerlaeota bacterium]
MNPTFKWPANASVEEQEKAAIKFLYANIKNISEIRIGLSGIVHSFWFLSPDIAVVFYTNGTLEIGPKSQAWRKNPGNLLVSIQSRRGLEGHRVYTLQECWKIRDVREATI